MIWRRKSSTRYWPVVVSRHNKRTGVSEFMTYNDWMTTNELESTSILGGISKSKS